MPPEPQNHAPCLSVVVQAYHEGATLAAVVEKLLRLPRLLKVVVVDDCSTDSTPEVARRLAAADSRVRVARHERPGTLDGQTYG